jgi:ubiquinone/menaquinone biosynthesis C-methylase UbiE
MKVNMGQYRLGRRRARTGGSWLDITTAYTILAPLYDFFRPWWIAVMAREAEECLESEILSQYVTPSARILDLGCGTGANLERLLRLALPFGTYTGLDLTPAMLSRARLKEPALGLRTESFDPSIELEIGSAQDSPQAEGLPKGLAPNVVKGSDRDRARLLRGDMHHLPFPDGSFDFVLSTWAVEHARPAEQVVCEGLRVLKPGGHLALLCHCCPPGPWHWLLRLTEGLLLMHCPAPDDLKSDAQILSRYFLGGVETLVLFRKLADDS